MKKQYKLIALVIGFSGVVMTSPVLAGGNVELEVLKQQMQEIIARNQQLTSRVAELEQVVKHQKVQEKVEHPFVSLTEKSDVTPLQTIANNLILSGTIEVEGTWGEDYAGASASDFALASADVALFSQVTDWATATLAFEWDDNNDKVTVDEAFVTLGKTVKYPAFVQAGRFVVPFGSYETNQISDPLGDDAFEVKEDAVMAGVDSAGFSARAYAFNGDTNEDGGESRIEQYGASVGYEREQRDVKYIFGVDYISSVFDADGLSEWYPGSLQEDYAAGTAVHGSIRLNGVGLITEYITTLDSVKDRQPEAWQVEGFYTTTIGEHKVVLSLAYNQTDDLAGQLPESRITAAASIALFNNIGFAVEYRSESDYDLDEGGTSEHADAITAQLSYEL